MVSRHVRIDSRDVNDTLNGPHYAVLAHDNRAVLHLLRRDEAPHGLTTPQGRRIDRNDLAG
jgi:hypothetical protein